MEWRQELRSLSKSARVSDPPPVHLCGISVGPTATNGRSALRSGNDRPLIHCAKRVGPFPKAIPRKRVETNCRKASAKASLAASEPKEIEPEGLFCAFDATSIAATPTSPRRLRSTIACDGDRRADDKERLSRDEKLCSRPSRFAYDTNQRRRSRSSRRRNRESPP